MHSFVEDFAIHCPHLTLTNSTRKRASELVHSWPLDTPLAVMHVDLWQPGAICNHYGCHHLVNAMCNMTQFAISVPCCDIHASRIVAKGFEQLERIMTPIIQACNLCFCHVQSLRTGQKFEQEDAVLRHLQKW